MMMMMRMVSVDMDVLYLYTSPTHDIDIAVLVNGVLVPLCKLSPSPWRSPICNVRRCSTNETGQLRKAQLVVLGWWILRYPEARMVQRSFFWT